MQAPATSLPDRPQLRDLCGQLEQVMLASLVPASLFATKLAGDDDEPSSASLTSGPGAALFSQALAAALERAGGFGLGAQIYQSLVKRPS